MPCISITAAIIAYISRNLNAAQVTNSLLPSMSWLEFHNLSGIIIAIISITTNLNNHNNIKKKIHLDLPVLQMVLHHRGQAHHGPSEVKLSSAESKVSTNFRRNFYSHNTRVFFGGVSWSKFYGFVWIPNSSCSISWNENKNFFSQPRNRLLCGEEGSLRSACRGKSFCILCILILQGFNFDFVFCVFQFCKD